LPSEDEQADGGFALILVLKTNGKLVPALSQGCLHLSNVDLRFDALTRKGQSALMG
jgi:hypothetical protein